MRPRYSSRALCAQPGSLFATDATWSRASRGFATAPWGRGCFQTHFLAAPDLFQVVVAAHARVHHVHDDVAQVDEHPFGVAAALHALRRRAELLQVPAHAIAERLD